MFTCTVCEYCSMVLEDGYPIIARMCNHPAVIECDFTTTQYKELTMDDYHKLNNLVTNILKLKVARMSIPIEGFEFPFVYDPVWINGCAGFKVK